jgi:hypothetical protein
MRLYLTCELPLSLILLCLIAPTFATPGVQQARSDGLHIPLQRRAARNKTVDEWAEWSQKEKLKLEMKYGDGAASRKRSSGYNLCVLE